MKLMSTRDELPAVPKQKHIRIDNYEFVTAWMKQRSVEAVANALHVTGQQVSTKAGLLRKKGVRLPKRTLHDYDDVEALNRLIERKRK